MICDLHVHSRYSFDGSVSMEEICAQAMKRGVEILAVTDHCDMVDGGEGIQGYLEIEEARLQELASTKEQFPGIEILYGIEIGNAIDKPEETKAFLIERKFDFVLGAIHFLPDGTDIYKVVCRSQKEVDDLFCQYFESIYKLADMGGFDSLAHLDYPMRILGNFLSDTSVQKYQNMIDPILKKLIFNNIAMEMNTRGMYDWQKRVGPEEWVWKRYKELGGSLVTIGSDAHQIKWIGEGFSDAAAVLQRAGFSCYTVYRGRKSYEAAF